MSIEIGKLYLIPKYINYWSDLYVKVIRKSDFYTDSIIAIDLKTGRELSFHRDWLNPIPKELADFSEEELKLYLRL